MLDSSYAKLNDSVLLPIPPRKVRDRVSPETLAAFRDVFPLQDLLRPLKDRVYPGVKH